MSFLSLTGHSTSMMTGGGNSESFLPLLERFKIVDTKDMLAELHAGPAWRGPTGGSAGDGKKAAGEVAGDGTRNLVRRATSLGEMATAAAAAKTRMMTKSTNAVSAASTRISRTTPPPPPPSSSSTPSPTPRSSGRTTPVFRPAGSRIREFSLRDAVVGGSESVSGSSGIRVGKRSTSVGGRASPALKIFSRMSVFTSSSLATSSVTTTTTTTTTTSENE
ncbi:hypothetical protein HK100_012470 [Physocladia obscura]|uniref:Uncharacterized protein n=1 Tax=Physocladia obscura TaxID=109957 RepID=A0AAD5TAS2_9FUNG|nr:hypothetical protein HK100_012470 [Physocladia obscura]